MGYRAHVASTYQVQYEEISTADLFHDFVVWLFDNDYEYVVNYYQGEFYEYSDQYEFGRERLASIRDKAPDEYKTLIDELLKLSDQRNDYINVDLY